MIDADGLVVAPGIVDIHTHYDPQLTWDPLCDTSALHGVTTVVAGNCGFSIAPCRADDHAYVAQMFARVEGMDPAALDRVPWGFATFPEFLASRRGALGHERRHVRRSLGPPALGDGRRVHTSAQSTDDGDRRDGLSSLDEAMAAGALGFSSSHAPTHLDLADRPVPSRLASLDEMRALADVVGGGRRRVDRLRAGLARSRASTPPTASCSSSWPTPSAACRSMTQGLGGRSKVDAPTKAWARVERVPRPVRRGRRARVLAADGPSAQRPVLRRQGHESLRGRPALGCAPEVAVGRRTRRELADPAHRARLRDAIDHPNRDPAKRFHACRRRSGSRSASPRSRPRRTEHFVGRSIGDLAAERGRHPADVLFDIALADDLETVFHWSNETPGLA